MGILEPDRRGRIVVLIMLGLALALASFATWYRLTHYGPALVPPARPVPGDTGRVQVEVLNGSATPGLGRIAMRRLRDAGLDVVFFGSDTTASLDSTQILVRRGDAGAAARVRVALGLGSVRTADDPARLVDITVRVGSDYGALVRKP